MYILIAATMIFGIIYSIYRIYEVDYPKEFAEHEDLISSFLAVSRTIKFIGDLYLHFVFITGFKFLLQYRSLLQG
jgi:hypothetical protein